MEDPEFEASLGYTEKPPFITSKTYSLALQSNILRSELQSPEAGTAGPCYWVEDNRQTEAGSSRQVAKGRRCWGWEGQVPFGWKQISFL